MREFSIEIAAENIDNSQTKIYFSEILSSYINGNYRSAVVMLWSVIIADFLYKLHSLKDLYQDETAIKILRDIETKQNANPKNPEWEVFLVDQIKERTNLLEQIEYENIKFIQKQRHLSAHPVLDAVNLLSTPNKDTTRSMIRNALEATLLKPPIFSKKITNHFVSDLAEIKDKFINQDDRLRKWLDAKYFKNLPNSVEEDLIKALWKFCFITVNDYTRANKEINLKVLKILYQRNYERFKSVITKESDKLSRVESSEENINSLIGFLSDCPTIYKTLNDVAKTLIENRIDQDINQLVSAMVFLEHEFSYYLDKLKTRSLFQLTQENIAWLKTSADESGLSQQFFEIGIHEYCRSTGYSAADSNFQKYIAKFIDEFDLDRILLMLDGIENNNQTYGRGRATFDHNSILSRIEKFSEIDMSQYKNFLTTISSSS